MCDDGNVCTVGDRCATGTCTGAPNPCDDGNPCTGTACMPGTGCTYVAAAGAACGPSDSCAWSTCDAAGVCRPFTFVCPGGTDECTTAYCDPTLGCQTMSNDGNSCCSGGFVGTCVGRICTVSDTPPWC